MSKSCSDSSARRTCSHRTIAPALLRRAASHPSDWRKCDPASCASHSALSATRAHGPPDVVLTPLCKLLAGSPSARPSGCRASHRGRSSIPCRQSTTELYRIPDGLWSHGGFGQTELALWSMVSKTPSGPLRHLKPTVQLSETP